ncbi:MAG TPA: hypothetical protein VI997_09580 [Candidatus Thermoplasmatota archaeon]|nr:hypothetical protein [Candidatus Thermoplasmatota archaeon]
MRPKFLALGAALAVLAALAWPPEPEQVLAPAASEPSTGASASAASTMQLVAVGLAAASLAFLLQGARLAGPEARTGEEDG